MAKKTSITLQITNPDGSVTESTSELESIIVGSGSGASVKLTDPKVSNLHCMFKVEKDGAVTVIDLGSESGTRFKEQPVKEPALVASGETVMIGESKVKIVYGEEKAVQAKSEEKKSDEKKEKGHKKDKKEKMVPSTKGLAGTGKNAAALFSEPLPAEAVPTESEKVLQVALLWGDTLINVQHFGEGVPVTIGDGEGNRFTVFNAGANFSLAQSRGAVAIVNVPSEAGLIVTTKSDSHKSKEQLKTEGKLKAADGGVRADAVELALHDRAQVSFNDVAFIIRFVRPSTHVTLNTFEEHDFTFFKIVSICLMAFFALVAAMVLTPLGFGGDGDDIFGNPSKYVKLMIKPEKKVEIKKFKDLSGIKEGEKPKEKEGKFGKQDAKKDQADPSKKRMDDQKKVSSLMASMFGGSSKSLFEAGLGTGVNAALGGLTGGAGVGDAQGVGGLGSRGSGAGGGGNGLGLGGLGTKGGGRGRGGYGSIDLGGKGKDSTRVIPGKTTVVGGLDKDVIMKVIKRHQNEIKFCYEQELQKNPALGGKVAVAWTIDPAGGVSEANVSESSIGNANVESCIVQRIRRWKFPEPAGGGVVNVTFPWIFKAAGDEGEE
ncbi:MAG: TonB family protein [Archangium sp.]|nr:TonB family protein [Archangium sp.]MDP3151382.1 TonB family protein [Archangium sp.]MDP3569005.1 TonB family protein [Archangium sp.]